MPADRTSIGTCWACAIAMPARACVMPGPPIRFAHAISFPPDASKTPAAMKAADSSLAISTARAPARSRAAYIA
eukprot:4893820-Prymnesium_polylepis.1